MSASLSSACYVTSKVLGRIPLASDVVHFACSRVEARRIYMELKPLCFSIWNKMGFESDEGTRLFQMLAATASFGARRLNFINYYSSGTNWKRLPDDPHQIMYGYW